MHRLGTEWCMWIMLNNKATPWNSLVLFSLIWKNSTWLRLFWSNPWYSRITQEARVFVRILLVAMLLFLSSLFSYAWPKKHADHWIQTASPEKFQLLLVSWNICIGWIYRTISSVEVSLFLMEPNPDLICYFVQSTCIRSSSTLRTFSITISLLSTWLFSD